MHAMSSRASRSQNDLRADEAPRRPNLFVAKASALGNQPNFCRSPNSDCDRPERCNSLQHKHQSGYFTNIMFDLTLHTDFGQGARAMAARDLRLKGAPCLMTFVSLRWPSVGSSGGSAG